MTSRRLGTFALLLFGSGFSALVYQTVWLRELRLVFGASTAATAAVLAIFMGGLGLGGFYLGPRADRVDRPIRWYATLELFIALTAVLSPALLWIVRKVYIATGGTFLLGSFAGNAVRLILASLVLLIPTVLMGGTLSAAARAVEDEGDRPRRGIGLLYGANTCGAVLGVLLPTFVLLEALGNRMTLLFGCLLNVLVALAAFLIDRSAAPQPLREVLQGKIPPTLRSRFILAAAAVAGFVFLLMELVWYRMLSPLLGGSTFTFGLILAVALFGIGLGGLLYGAHRREREPSLQQFALVSAFEALCIAYPFALGDGIAVLALLLRSLGSFGFYGLAASWLLVVAIVVLPAAIVAGYQFPLLIGLLGSGGTRVGKDVGYVYAANTLGAIAGSLAGGFGLLPLLTAPGAWRLSVLVLLVLALVSAWIGGWRRERVLSASAITLLLLTVFAVTRTGPTAVWRHSPIGAGRVPLPVFLSGASPNGVRDWIRLRRRATKWEAEGVESSIALLGEDGLGFLINGKSDGHSRYDAGTQVMIGALGGLLHSEPRRALVIGLGTGSTAGWIAAVPSIEQVNVVELERETIHVARACSQVNHEALSSPKISIHIGDAREFLLTDRTRYDLILSEPSNPYRAGVASLFTDDFYRAVSRRLTDEGLFLQWLQAYEVDSRTVRTVYATLKAVFLQVDTWQTLRGDLLLVGSNQVRALDVPELRRKIGSEPFRSALRLAWRVDDLEGVIARFVCGDVTASMLADGARRNTDDRTIIEFAAARTVGRESGFDVSQLRAEAQRRGDDLPRIHRGTIDRSLLARRRLGMFSAEGGFPVWLDTVEPSLVPFVNLHAAWAQSDYAMLSTVWASLPHSPSDEIEMVTLVEALAEKGDERALSLIDALARVDAIEADALRARLFLRAGRPEEAAENFRKAFVAYRSNPWPIPIVMSRALDLVPSLAQSSPSAALLLFDALERPFALMMLEEKRLALLPSVVRRIEQGAETRYCMSVLGQYGEHPPWQEEVLLFRRDCYRRAGSPRLEQARGDLARFRSREPVPLGP
ncbi:MAG TPA: fused MFS/spermidine synthase [Thermoanaerobaculia bacterium]|nr:fused MFS/spermidine synthase [Thermoanaerobaculia bacterium]